MLINSNDPSLFLYMYLISTNIVRHIGIRLERKKLAQKSLTANSVTTLNFLLYTVYSTSKSPSNKVTLSLFLMKISVN